MPRARSSKKSSPPAVRGKRTGIRKAPASPVSSTASAITETELHALLAQRVRTARAQRAMTRKQLARQSGISPAYLARLENGTGNISLSLLHRLAVAFNLPIENFLSPAETHNADLALVLEFLKRQKPAALARIRRLLFDEFDAGSGRGQRRIAFIGMRGAGKSTVGRSLALQLGIPFVELNREIEREAGIAASEIFLLYGQHGYRQLEQRCLERIVTSHPKVVLATGGGIVTEPATFELLLSSFYTIWLKAKPQTIFNRVMAQHDARFVRQQLRDEAMHNINRIFEAREHLYQLADLAFETSGKTVEHIARSLLHTMSTSLKKAPAVTKRVRLRKETSAA